MAKAATIKVTGEAAAAIATCKLPNAVISGGSAKATRPNTAIACLTEGDKLEKRSANDVRKPLICSITPCMFNASFKSLPTCTKKPVAACPKLFKELPIVFAAVGSFSSSVITPSVNCAALIFSFCKSSLTAVPNAFCKAARICGTRSANWFISSAEILPLLATCESAKETPSKSEALPPTKAIALPNAAKARREVSALNPTA